MSMMSYLLSAIIAVLPTEGKSCEPLRAVTTKLPPKASPKKRSGVEFSIPAENPCRADGYMVIMKAKAKNVQSSLRCIVDGEEQVTFLQYFLHKTDVWVAALPKGVNLRCRWTPQNRNVVGAEVLIVPVNVTLDIPKSEIEL
jgi:hypothetical protein